MEDRLAIIHFAGSTKPGGNKPCPVEMEELCLVWRNYRARVLRDIIHYV